MTHLQGGNPDDVLRLSGSDDLHATSKLADFLRRHKIHVLHETPTAVMVEHHDRKFALSPKIQSEGLDRVVLHEFWAARHGSSRRELMDLCNRLNNQYNTGSFYVDDDGDLGYQTQMTFMESLTWNELEAFLTWHEFSLLTVLIRHQNELAELLQ